MKSQLKKLYNLFNPHIGIVLMMHRVLEQKSVISANRKIEITPAFLLQIIEKYQDNGYTFVSLDDVLLYRTGKKKLKLPFVALTFDDGYLDLYETAYPLLKKKGIPFLVYITTDNAFHKADLWWYALEEIVQQNNEIILSTDLRYACNTIEEKNNVYEQIRSAIQQKPESISMKEYFQQILPGYPVDFEKLNRKNLMPWEQITELSKDALCSVGSHTVSHPFLTHLSPPQITYELSESKNILETELGRPIIHFSYPFGDYNNDIIEKVKEAGYKTATVISGGMQRKWQNLLSMKRLEVTEN